MVLFMSPNDCTITLFQDFVTYSITGYSDGPDYFNISDTTGTIFIKTDLRSDRNKKASYLVRFPAFLSTDCSRLAVLAMSYRPTGASVLSTVTASYGYQCSLYRDTSVLCPVTFLTDTRVLCTVMASYRLYRDGFLHTPLFSVP